MNRHKLGIHMNWKREITPYTATDLNEQKLQTQRSSTTHMKQSMVAHEKSYSQQWPHLPLHKATPTPHVLQVQKHVPAFDAFSVPPDEPNQQNVTSGISGANMPCSGYQMNQSIRMCRQKPLAVLATLITTANSQTGRSANDTDH